MDLMPGSLYEIFITKIIEHDSTPIALVGKLRTDTNKDRIPSKVGIFIETLHYAVKGKFEEISCNFNYYNFFIEGRIWQINCMTNETLKEDSLSYYIKLLS